MMIVFGVKGEPTTRVAASELARFARAAMLEWADLSMAAPMHQPLSHGQSSTESLSAALSVWLDHVALARESKAVEVARWK